ncbi:MAG: hypothetical protein IPI67_17210 [Myxococcales bacterium]|nr:hypothetical protein [Myxococcales bacterium]
MSAKLRVQLIHGLEGSPTGAKSQYLARHFELSAPAMNTGDFQGSVATQAAALAVFRPDVLVGSSFGGAVAVLLLQRQLWRGPSLLLAPAVGHFGVDARIPDGVRVTVVHGRSDTICPIEWSRALTHTGTVGLVELVEVDDEHRLASLLEGEKLADLVRALGSAADRG